MKSDDEETIRRLARDGNYSLEAFRFLFEALEHALVVSGKEQAEGTERHLTGQELLEGLRQYALQILGPLAAQTWRAWGVRTGMDWGRIVFLLVEAGMLNRQDSDSPNDFADGFDFDDYFVRGFRPRVKGHLGEAS